MEKIAKRMGAIDEDLTPEEIRSNRQYLDRVLRFKRMVGTDIEGYTNIMNINVTGTDPKEVQELANTVATVFKEENTKEKNKRTIEARKFIEKRLNEVETELNDVQNEIKTFKEENRFIDEMMEVTDLIQKINELELKLQELGDKKKDMELLIDQLEQQSTISRDNAIKLIADEKDPTFFNMNRKRTQMLTEREVLLVEFTGKYFGVIALDVQLKEIEKNMMNHLKKRHETMVRLEEDVKSQLDRVKDRHKQLPGMAFTLDDLEYELKNTRELYRDLTVKHQEILIKSSEMVEEVSIVRPALEPRSQINPPKVGATTGIGTMVGLLLGLVIAFVLETMDTSIGTIEDVEGFLDIPVLGVIPLIRPEEIRATLEKKGDIEQSAESLEMNARLISHFAPKSNLAESFRALRTSIKFLVLEKNIKTLMVTSSTAREGKSTTMANMALTLAQIGSRVLLVDADLRKPMVNRVFGIEKEPGLTDIILGNYEWRDTIKTVTDIMMGRLGMEDIMTSPGIDNLNIITAGTHSPNTTELVSSQRMSDFLDEAKEDFDVVLVDCPPVLQATDSVIISTKVDAVVLIYWAGKIQRGALKRAKSQIDNVNASVIGIVLNGLKPEVSADYKYYGYYSYYGYGDARDEMKKTVWTTIKERIPMPLFITKTQVKLTSFIKEKDLFRKFINAFGPVKSGLKSFIEHRHVERVIKWAPVRFFASNRFLYVVKAILTAIAFAIMIAGLYWQIFLM